MVDAPLEREPLFVRSGAVIPKIPEDVMTLVPNDKSQSSSVQHLDNRREYEIYPGPHSTLIDFEGRTLSFKDSPNGEIEIQGAPARVTLVWRRAPPASITVNGAPARLEQRTEGVAVTIDHKATTTVVLH